MRSLGSLLPVLALSCVHATGPVSLAGVDGKRQSFEALLERAPFTVVVFVSASCPCMQAHQERLEDIAADFGRRGVQMVAVDSEADATPARLAAEAREYSVPVLLDEGGRLANQLGAEFATYTVVLDRRGQAHYRGGIDSDRTVMHPDAVLYVRDALEDLLAGKSPRRPEGKALGCTLRKW